jgi:RNA polymerase sigma-70 factor (ECF subfamily)
MIQNEGDTEDLVQETMIKVSRSWDSFRGDSALSSWIFKIASNVCVDYFRYSSLRPGLVKEETTVEAPSADGVLSQVASKETKSCVHDNITALPDSYQRILIMYYMDGASLKQIASDIGISANSAKVRLHRARKRFRGACVSTCDISSDKGGNVVCGPKS